MMKPTDPSLGHHRQRLVCHRCGMSVFAGLDVDHELTSISHAGVTPELERSGYEVTMDLCRHCLREILRSWLGADGAARPPGSGECEAAHVALRSPESMDTFIRESNARLDALRRADEAADGGP